MEFHHPPALRVPVTWYFCDEDAGVLPFSTRFGSGNWASSREVWPTVGECLDAARAWSNGEPPGPPTCVVKDHFFFPGSWATANEWEFPSGLTFSADTSIILVIAYRVEAGAGLITSVTDSDNRLYFKDFSEACALDATLRIDVWRAPNLVGHRNGNVCKFHFLGSTIVPTVWMCTVNGLEADGPFVDVHKSGTTPDKPNVDAFKTGHLSQFVLAVVAGADISAIASNPTGFTNLGFNPSGALVQGGEACWRSIDSSRSLTLKWNATIAAPWLAIGLVYQGKKKEVPKGKKFCGTQDIIEFGPALTAPRVCADNNGYAACCFDYTDHVNCCNFEEATFGEGSYFGRIVGIHNPQPNTAGVVGKTYQFFRNATPNYWGAFGKRYNDDPPDRLLLFFGCNDGFVSFNDLGPPDGRNLVFNEKPFGLLGNGIFIGPNPGDETWDVVVNEPPPPRPLPPKTAAVFPPGFWPYTYFPPNYL